MLNYQNNKFFFSLSLFSILFINIPKSQAACDTCSKINMSLVQEFPLPSPNVLPNSIIYSKDGKHLALTCENSNTVVVLDTASNGTVSFNQSIPSGNFPIDIDYSPDGQYLSICNLLDASVNVFKVQPNGTLAYINGNLANSTYPTGAGASFPTSIVYSPNQKFLATANQSNNISVFNVNPSGTLGVASVFPSLLTGTNGLAYSLDNLQLSVAGYLSNKLEIFDVDQTNGSLTANSNVSTQNAPVSPFYSPDGKFLTVANNFSNSVTVYKVNSDGSLSPINGTVSNSSFATLIGPVATRYSKNGDFLAVVNSANIPDKVSIFCVDKITGALSNRKDFGNFSIIDYLFQDIDFSPDGRFLAVPESGNSKVIIIKTGFIPAPIITSPANFTITTDPIVTLIGTTVEPNATITIYNNGIQIGTTTADANGNWTFTTPKLPDGTNQITVTATDNLDNVSCSSEPVKILLNGSDIFNAIAKKYC